MPTRLLSLALLALLSLPASAAQPDDGPAAPPPAYARYPDTPVTTRHTLAVGGRDLDYLATAGTITLVKDESGQQATARIFFIAYRQVGGVREGLEALAARELTGDQLDRLDRRLQAGEEAQQARVDALLEAGVDAAEVYQLPDPATRPVTFSFNGGPGSSSVWLHLGLFGPKRVQHADDFGNAGPPPYTLVPNEFTLLDASDFVFIDPVSTGFSRAEGETDAKDFHGLTPDVEAVAEFIRRWLSDHARWASPKFVAGESYGTTRAAGLVRELQGAHGIAVNGVVLISAVLDFQTIRFVVGNDLPPVLYLPSFAATAHFHGQLEPDLQARPLAEVLGEVEAFAAGDYAHALFAGDALPDDQRRRIAERVARYTGLTPEYVLRTNLRVNMPRFPKELRRDEGITVGRLDSRFTAADRDDAGDTTEFDPSYAAIQSLYTQTLNDYVRRELRFESDLRYEILTGVGPWSYRGRGDNQYANVAEDLRATMQRVPSMRVFVASGHYDLATPYWATDYTLDHLSLRPDLRDNVEVHYYDAGHMMYVHHPSLEAISADLHGFYERALGR